MAIDKNEFKQLLIDRLNLEDLEIEDIEDDMALFGDEGLGLDSVDSIELVLLVEKEYGVKIQDPKEYDKIFVNIQSLYEYINEKKQ